MTVQGKISGVRIYPSGKRYVTIEWSDEKTEENQYPISHSFEIQDQISKFQLSDDIEININTTYRSIGVTN